MNAPLHPRPRGRFAADSPAVAEGHVSRQPLGRRLVEAGLLEPADLARALDLQSKRDARIGEILSAHNLVDRSSILAEVAHANGLHVHDGTPLEIAAELRVDITPEDCLNYGFAPLRRIALGTLVAITHPDRVDAIRRKLPASYGALKFVLVDRDGLHCAVAEAFPQHLAARAEARPDARDSCRTGTARWLKLVGLLMVATLPAACVIAPSEVLRGVLVLGFVTMIATLCLKVACLLAALKYQFDAPDTPQPKIMPKFSILVPLYREAEIAETLVRRLGRLVYPVELLEIVLVLEADDAVTQATLARTDLPKHMRAITAPPGTLKTKPRALNYALEFTDGQIIGVYDAEDAPAPDQLVRVAQTFAGADKNVACVQGVLSFYNWSRNWLARCFFFEYAGWFRVVLPGLSRLGFAVPLGGTTLFFRRAALLELGAWDAHNVTEDADLGIRLARYGYSTTLISSITEEEANCQVWPWIKQRSRWLKGYAVTWAVHMRAPLGLLREMGLKRFLGFQVLFLGTLTSFFLAPLFWLTSGLLASGVLSVSTLGLTPRDFLLATGLFMIAETINIVIYWIASRRVKRRPNLLWALTLPIYFVLASVATYKAFAELWRRPFFWDKTAHGQFGGTTETDTEQDLSNVVELPGIDLEPYLEGDRKMITKRF